MAQTVKLFQFAQKIYKMMGIRPSKSSQPGQTSSFNLKMLAVLFIVAQLLLSSTAFLIFQADSLQKWADSFYFSLSIANCGVYIIVSYSKIVKILNLIGNFEAFIEQSKSNENERVRSGVPNIPSENSIDSH